MVSHYWTVTYRTVWRTQKVVSYRSRRFSAVVAHFCRGTNPVWDTKRKHTWLNDVIQLSRFADHLKRLHHADAFPSLPLVFLTGAPGLQFNRNTILKSCTREDKKAGYINGLSRRRSTAPRRIKSSIYFLRVSRRYLMEVYRRNLQETSAK